MSSLLCSSFLSKYYTGRKFYISWGGILVCMCKLSLTVVDRLNFKKNQLFFTKFAYDYNFVCRMPGIDQKVEVETFSVYLLNKHFTNF